MTLASCSLPSEDDLVRMLVDAAGALGRTDLLPDAGDAPAEYDGDAASAPASVPARAALLLDRAQYDGLTLWFEVGAVPQADGYSVKAKLKSLLFDMLADSNGRVDLQQLLLYACDEPSKAFAVLGFASQKMLSLDGLYELLHREPAPQGFEPPEHLDPCSRAALRRLFTELKLSEVEQAPYSYMVNHPLGAAMIGSCASYVRKDAYNLVAELVSNAGTSLKI